VLAGLAGLCGLGGCALFADLGEFDGYIDVTQDASNNDSSLADVANDHSSTHRDTGTKEGGGNADAGDSGAPNLIVNPSFEEGLSPWTTFDDNGVSPLLGVSSAHAHSGQYSGWVSQRTQPFEGTVQDLTRVVVPGHTYSMIAWAMVGPGPDVDGGDPPLDGGDPPADSGDASRDSGDAGDAGADAKDAALDAGDATLDVMDASSDAADAPLDAPGDVVDGAGPATLSQPVYAAVAVRCLVDTFVVTTRRPIDIALGNSTTWTELYGVFTVPTASACKLVSFQVYVAGPDPGVELFVDDVSVVP
jgi:hypothetical protein